MRSKLNLLCLIFFIITILGCGSDMNTSSNDTGSASFSLKWETPQNPDNMSLRALSLSKGEAISELSYAPIDCTAIGVSTVSANVYDSGGTYITSGGPWNCADHSGTITGISAGINRMIAISGKDSSSRIIYNGQITGITIDKDQTTNAGQITMTYVANDTTAPTDGTLSASAGNSQVSLSWSGFSDSGSGLGSYKLVYSTTSTPSSCSSGTQIWTGTGTSYTHTGLTNSTTYYYRICAIDNAGNTSSGATTSGIPASSAGTTTTGSAPSAPTGVSATAGNGQTTISWSSVSGATSYNIYWSTSSGVTKTNGTKITGATSPYTHTGRTNGTTYYYVVTAVNSYGESSESSQVSAIPKKVFQVDTGGTLTTGLVAYYKLEDATDFYGVNNGTNSGATFDTGKINNGATQDATSDRIQLPNFDINTANSPFSVNVWFKTNDTSNPSNGRYIVNKRKGTMTFHIGTKRSDSSKIEMSDFSGVNFLSSTVTINDNVWHMMTLVVTSASNATIYIDGGNAVNSTTMNFASQDIADSFMFGGLDSGNNLRSWLGMYDEIGMWGKALSTTEISDLYNGGSGQTMQ